MTEIIFSSDVIQEMIDMYNGGMSFRGIARVFNTHHPTVKKAIKDNIIQRPTCYYSRIRAKPKTCVNCGVKFILRDENGCMIPRYKTCSDKCLHEFLKSNQEGEKSYNWKNGGSQSRYQRIARESKDMVCEVCGERNVRLDVHHKNKDKTDNTAENIMILCVSCHAKLHYYNGDTRIRGSP